ncbi:MAG: FecR domain-containing protein [Bacteroidales bacterium]|jgi:ferric-dicitrate binding protein FerR (iron transport regulator)|nr:FecR domain-containing protein [Bacteroidales bacterium]
MNSEKMEIQNHDKEYWIGMIMDRLAGSLSDEGRKRLDEWRSASDENGQLFADMRKMWHALSLSDRNETFNEQRAYRLFRERVEAETGMAKRIPMKPYRLLRRIASYAAVIISFVSLGYFTYRYFTTTPARTVTPLLSEVAAPNGSKTQLLLQDGTRVWLNAVSHIRYNSEFGRTNRNLSLSGEAYFEVAKDEQLPFIVDVEGIKVKVLGTHFNVNAYRENNGVAIALLEGVVEIIANNGNVTLKPGDMARYDAASGQIAISANAIGDALAWMNNKLVFTGETFEQIISNLERSYNVKVNIHNNQIKKRRFAGDFTNNETIEQIFTVMSVNGKFRYQIKGNVIDIY